LGEKLKFGFSIVIWCCRFCFCFYFLCYATTILCCFLLF